MPVATVKSTILCRLLLKPCIFQVEILSAAKIEMMDMIRIEPDVKGNWLNQTSNDFETLLPVATRNFMDAKPFSSFFASQVA